MSILESINIGANALQAHGLRLDIHAKNIANVDTRFLMLLKIFLSTV